MTKTTDIIFVVTLLLISLGVPSSLCETHLGVSCGGGPAGKSRYRSSEKKSSEGNGQRKGLLGLNGFLGSKDDRSVNDDALADLPMERLTRQAQQRLSQIASRPSLYRRLPQQTIACDPELFLFLSRKPDTMIGIWDLMGITRVQTRRTGPYRFEAVDGSGTTCMVDLIYGDQNLHVFIAEGEYDGKFVQKPVRGRGVFILRSQYGTDEQGAVQVIGTLDCYVKFESLGADLVARSLGGLIGKSADHNFAETAKFIGQISAACEDNPDGLYELVGQMKQMDEKTKREFATVISNVARRHHRRQAAGQLARRGQPSPEN